MKINSVEIHKLRCDQERHLCASFMAGSDPWLRLGQSHDGLLQLLADPTKEIYVATTQDEVAGFIILDMHGSFTGYIKTLGVLPQWQGKGIGKKLVTFAEEHIFLQSPNVFLCVSSFNTNAQQFYKHFGYQVVGTLENYLMMGHDEILMRKTIGPLNGE